MGEQLYNNGGMPKKSNFCKFRNYMSLRSDGTLVAKESSTLKHLKIICIMDINILARKAKGPLGFQKKLLLCFKKKKKSWMWHILYYSWPFYFSQWWQNIMSVKRHSLKYLIEHAWVVHILNNKEEVNSPSADGDLNIAELMWMKENAQEWQEEKKRKRGEK